tara:strand:- start:5319 stop:6101 length:783 start_codon:yes stop_codon:yes gene_type:complete
MRIALCFYGLVGSTNFKYGSGKSLNPNLCANLYKKNFISHHDKVDIFIHSQSYDFKEKLIKIYKPKKSLIEKKKNFFWKAFFHPKVLLSIIISLKNFDLKFKDFKDKHIRTINAFSRWYSTKTVVMLKKKYEKERNKNYDLVLLTRLDWAFLKPLRLNKNMKKKFIVSNHNDVPSPRNKYKSKVKKNNKTEEKGLADYWFIGGNDIINNFSKVYDRKYSYEISPHVSSFQHSKFLKQKISFLGYRGIDHELMRRIKKSTQ